MAPAAIHSIWVGRYPRKETTNDPRAKGPSAQSGRERDHGANGADDWRTAMKADQGPLNLFLLMASVTMLVVLRWLTLKSGYAI
jgi:hypothetical protein